MALSGGGARGSAEISIIGALVSAGVKFDCVSGISVGTIIGAYYCLHGEKEFSRKEKEFLKWLSIKQQDSQNSVIS